jgi:hypothetical protein
VTEKLLREHQVTGLPRQVVRGRVPQLVQLISVGSPARSSARLNHRWTVTGFIGRRRDSPGNESFESNRFELTSVFNRHFVGQGGASNLVALSGS